MMIQVLGAGFQVLRQINMQRL